MNFSNMNKLDELAIKYNTDKSSLSHYYTKWYNQYFNELQEQPIKLLEIGIENGGSLKTWEEYFIKAKIVGIDIEPRCLQYKTNQNEIYIGDQTDINFLNDIINIEKEFDIIIDDGGHTWKQQIISFHVLFPILKPGGIYVVEDLHAGYVSKWQDYTQSFMAYIYDRVDDLQHHGKTFCANVDLIRNTYEANSLNYFERTIEYIHFYKGVVFIKKLETHL